MNCTVEQRQHWMAVLAKAPTDSLLSLSDEAV